MTEWLDIHRHGIYYEDPYDGPPQFKDIPERMQKNINFFWRAFSARSIALIYVYVYLEITFGTATEAVRKTPQCYSIAFN